MLDALRRTGIEPHVIGGAAIAVELDALGAIRQGAELAAPAVMSRCHARGGRPGQGTTVQIAGLTATMSLKAFTG
jgi:hypothetical protein